MANVVMAVTGDVDVAKWCCEGCGKWISYAQPVPLSLLLDIVKLFMQAHAKCEQKGAPKP